jgi:hypothetical protein
MFIALLFTTLYSYESEDKLKVVVVGKIAKFIEWQNDRNSEFVITVFRDREKSQLFKKIFSSKSIKERDVQVVTIDSLDELDFTHILYIPEVSNYELNNILSATHHKNILTISDIRGFAEKGGVVQLYISSRKIRLKINHQISKEHGFKISSSLLRIATIINE